MSTDNAREMLLKAELALADGNFFRARQIAKNAGTLLDATEKLHRRFMDKMKFDLDAEHEDGCYRDQSVFGDGISIEDTMGVMVRYKNGAIMTYSLNAYLPWEGFRVAINGSKGRLQVLVTESSYVNAGGESAAEGAARTRRITLFPMHGEPTDVEIPEAVGGHGGGDAAFMNAFVELVRGGQNPQAITDARGALESHLMAFAAEQSRLESRTILMDQS